MSIIREKSFKEWISKFIIMIIACLIMAIASALFYVANLQPSHAGIDTLGAFIRGIELTFNISFGTATIIVNAFFVLLSIIFMRKNIYFATVITLLLLGPFIDFFSPFFIQMAMGWPDLVRGILFTILGTIIYGTGIAMYLPLNWGTTPMDGVILIVFNRTPLSYKLSFAACCITSATIGFALGSTIGYATVIAGLCMGIVADFLLKPFSNLFKKLNIIDSDPLSDNVADAT